MGSACLSPRDLRSFVVSGINRPRQVAMMSMFLRETLRCMRARLPFAVVLAMLAGTVQGEESTPRTRQRIVPAVAFQPASNSTNYVVEAGGLGRLCLFKGAGYFVAPLYLEDGTTIDRITVFLEDSSRDAMGMMSLVRRGAQAFEILATTPVSTGTDEVESLSTTTISSPVIDNQSASYLLQVVLTNPGVCLHSAQVTYHGP